MTEPALAHNVRGKGRHYTHPVTGEDVPSVTNCIDVLNKPALPRWAAKLVAEKAWKLRHSLPEMDEADCVDTLKASPWQKSGRDADRGSSIHDYLEICARSGQPAADAQTGDLSADAIRYLPAAKRFLQLWQPEFLRTEFTVFGADYAGTADFMARINGRVVLGDYKTSKAIYPEVALQLAALRHAALLVTPDGEEPMPEVDETVAVLITPSGSQVYPVRSGRAELEAFRACVAAWRWVKGESPVGEPWEEPS